MEFSVQFECEDVRLTDLVYRRYGGGANSILSMPFFEGCKLIKFAQDAEHEDRLFLRWAVKYQTYMGFEEFKQQIEGGGETDDSRSADEILATVKGIIG